MSKLRRPFPRYFFITVRLLPRRTKLMEKRRGPQRRRSALPSSSGSGLTQKQGSADSRISESLRLFPRPLRYPAVLQLGTTLGKDFLHFAFAVDDPQHKYFFGCHKAIENNIRAYGKAAITGPDFIALPA